MGYQWITSRVACDISFQQGDEGPEVVLNLRVPFPFRAAIRWAAQLNGLRELNKPSRNELNAER